MYIAACQKYWISWLYNIYIIYANYEHISAMNGIVPQSFNKQEIMECLPKSYKCGALRGRLEGLQQTKCSQGATQ